MTSSSFIGMNGTSVGGGAGRSVAWKPASTGIHGKATSGSAHAERMRRMRIMHGVGGDPDARYPRKLAHSESGDNLSSVVDRWGGSRFDYLDPALRPALTEWTHFDEVDNQLRGHAKRRIEVDFLRNRMEQLHSPFAERSQQGVEVLEYFNMGGHAFACVVAEEMPREPGVYQFVRHFYVEALNSEQAQAVAYEQQQKEQARADQLQREEDERRQAEEQAAMLAQIDQEEKEREEYLAAQARTRAEMERHRLAMEASAPPDLNGIKRRVRHVVAARFGDGMKGIRRFFDSVDTDRSGKWSLRDMMDGLRDYGIPYTEKEITAFYNYLDVHRRHAISFDSFFIFIKGELSPARKELVNLAFDKVDVDHSNEITAEDIATFYDASMHPEVMSGKKTVDQVLRAMIDDFELRGVRDGKVSREEFEDYYGSVGAYIDDDAYFALMLKRAWQME